MSDICVCPCHRPTKDLAMIHCFPCCIRCRKCDQMIQYDRYGVHERDCKPTPSASSSPAPEPLRCAGCDMPMGYGGVSTHGAKCPVIEPRGMTVEEACEILNRHRHELSKDPKDGFDRWYVNGDFVRGPDRYDCHSHFEAIAIAEKYQRESE